MDGGTRYSIGEPARRTGLTVKTIRLFSDRIVPPADRTPSGYRRCGPEAVARLALVRTLREPGLGLEAIRQIVDRDRPLAQGPSDGSPWEKERRPSGGRLDFRNRPWVAAEHAAALDP